MVDLPWRRGRDGDAAGDGEPASPDPDPASPDPDDGPLVECAFQDGTLSVYADRVVIERAGPSRFDDKTIPRDEITDVRYAKGIAIGYLQIEQTGFENARGGFLTSPVDENTLHFGRGARGCAREARDELLFGTG